MGSRSHIIYPTNYATKYLIDYSQVKKHAFSETKEEDPQAHLMFFDALWGTSKIKDLSRVFVLLELFKFSLKDKVEQWYNILQYHNITSWKMCAEKFMAKFPPAPKL